MGRKPTISWNEIPDDFFIGKADSQAARELSKRYEFKISSAQIRYQRIGRKIEATKGRHTKIPWHEVDDSIFIGKTEREIAKILSRKYKTSIHPQSVNYQRHKRGLSKTNLSVIEKCKFIEWRKLPLGIERDEEIAKKLNLHPDTVAKYRNKLKIKLINRNQKPTIPKCCIEMLVAKRIYTGMTVQELSNLIKYCSTHLNNFENLHQSMYKNTKLFWRYAKAVSHIRLPLLNDELIKRLDGNKQRIKNV